MSLPIDFQMSFNDIEQGMREIEKIIRQGFEEVDKNIANGFINVEKQIKGINNDKK